jgi:hypothetical protein
MSVVSVGWPAATQASTVERDRNKSEFGPAEWSRRGARRGLTEVQHEDSLAVVGHVSPDGLWFMVRSFEVSGQLPRAAHHREPNNTV